MATWLPFFVILAAVAIMLQAAILFAIYKEVRRARERITRFTADLYTRMDPVLSRLQVLVEDIQPRLSSIVADASEITHLARGQAQKVDRIFSEAVDRLRMQIIHADHVLTGALEAVEEAGSKVRRTIWGPVHQASALIKGVKVGLDFFRSQRRPSDRTGEQPDEGLFI